MVVYQTESKIAWLKLDERKLSDPRLGPVSAWASRSLAERLLIATPHATISAAITGHFGPGSPPELDGMIYMAALSRTADSVLEREFRLQKPAPKSPDDISARRDRQVEATHVFLEWMNNILDI